MRNDTTTVIMPHKPTPPTTRKLPYRRAWEPEPPLDEAWRLRQRARRGTLSYPTFRRLARVELASAQRVIWGVPTANLRLAALCGDEAAATLVGAPEPPDLLAELLCELGGLDNGHQACVRAALAIANEESLDRPWLEADARLLCFVSWCELDPSLADPLELKRLSRPATERSGIARWVAAVAAASNDWDEVLTTGLHASDVLGWRRHLMHPIWRMRVECELAAWALGFRDPLLRRTWSDA